MRRPGGSGTLIAMILVRRRAGQWIYLARELDETSVRARLAVAHPGAPIELLERQAGLLILSAGNRDDAPGDGETPGPGAGNDRLAIVRLDLGATPIAFPPAFS